MGEVLCSWIQVSPRLLKIMHGMQHICTDLICLESINDKCCVSLYMFSGGSLSVPGITLTFLPANISKLTFLSISTCAHFFRFFFILFVFPSFFMRYQHSMADTIVFQFRLLGLHGHLITNTKAHARNNTFILLWNS